MKLIERNLSDYIELVTSDAPAPGGGSASALCGAQGIGLIAMVARLTIGKAKYAEFEADCQTALKTADELCLALTRQIDHDTEAFGKISAAFKLPKETDVEKALRRKTIDEATLFATEVPFQTMVFALEGLKCCEKLVGRSNPNCASDIGCGALGLLSCVKGAWLNVLINVGGVKDTDKAEQFKCNGAKLEAEAEALAEKIYTTIRHGL